jgi:hypothetical protein
MLYEQLFPALELVFLPLPSEQINSRSNWMTIPNKGLSKCDQVQRAFQVLGRAMASTHPTWLGNGIVAGATATSSFTNPSSLRSSCSGAGGGGSDTSIPLYMRLLLNSLV